MNVSTEAPTVTTPTTTDTTISTSRHPPKGLSRVTDPVREDEGRLRRRAVRGGATVGGHDVHSLPGVDGFRFPPSMSGEVGTRGLGTGPDRLEGFV